jgi:hypothetical protein
LEALTLWFLDSRWDEWVGDDMILQINDENTRKFQELQEQRKALAKAEEKRAAAAKAKKRTYLVIPSNNSCRVRF